MLDHLALDHYPVGVAAIALSVAIVLACQIAMRKIISPETLKKAHEVGGYYLALVGTFYAVLLGLVVLDAMAKFQTAEKTVQNEAKALLSILSLAEQFPREQASIKAFVRDYAREVAADEWARMEKGEISQRAQNDLLALAHLVKGLDPKTQNQQSVHAAMLSESISLWESRLERTRVSNFGVPSAEWTVLLVGALITIAFTFFFTIESHGIHLIMRGMVTLLIAMSLYLVLLFGSPFSGDLKVSERPFLFVTDVASH
ncbi:hypothetical protein WOC76_24140 [Methylocystis sp. IM3]|jgi:hypothetical protein|uniref:bestrophin-like domain n=1 Tax=unclassified Methylocystis TaxID=2625913 RepID=UPI000FB40251|nr:MAG: DUF4239 domain-containing protein [Hyphomicrobiales bacterium]